MSLLRVENLSFRYNKEGTDILNNVSFSVEKGEFLVLCGSSGSGKTTLLRHLKPMLAPQGEKNGTIFWGDDPIEAMNVREQAGQIGFVMQQPDSQIAVDKVWHEMVFGLENLGLDQQTIERRVAETASYFGIQNWFHKETGSLSGGQKQLLNLASVMAMRPKLLVLDDPVSRLDPIAARNFIETVGRLNREMGMAVIIAEHNLDEVFALCDRVIVLDHGRIYSDGTPQETGAYLARNRHVMALSMPTPMRIYAACNDGQKCPVSVKEGHEWLDHFAAEHPMRALPGRRQEERGEPCLCAARVWYRYPQEETDVLCGASLNLYAGEWLAVLGGNGSGKSTLLKVLSGNAIPWRGNVRKKKEYRIAVLPQEPKTMFRGFTVAEELDADVSDELWSETVTRCRLEGLLPRHPFDLSGGESQRAALAKLLLTQPDILMMDEPTKGLDAENKRAFAEIIDGLCRKGVAVLMVSHDLEFCAEHAHYCYMLFDGKLQSEQSPREFCADNRFYTTAAHRMASHYIPEAATCADVIYACGGKEVTVDPPEHPLLPKRKSSAKKNSALKPLPCSGKGIKPDVILMLLPAILAATLLSGSFLLKNQNYMALSFCLMAEILAAFFLSFERKRPGAREIAMVAVLCALGIVGRGAFFMLPQFKPVSAIVILSGVAFGPLTGFLVGSGTMLASNLFFGQGPWTPWQMCAMGGIGFFSGFLFCRKTCRLWLCIWGGLSVFLFYGVVMNLSSAMMYQPELNWKIIVSYLISGAPFDMIHGGSTVLFLWILSEEFLKKMYRMKEKFNLQMG